MVGCVPVLPVIDVTERKALQIANCSHIITVCRGLNRHGDVLENGAPFEVIKQLHPVQAPEPTNCDTKCSIDIALREHVTCVVAL